MAVLHVQSIKLIFLSILIGIFSCNSITGKTSEATTSVASKPVIIEIVAKPGEQPNADALSELCAKNGVSASAIYRWKNHLAVFEHISEPENLRKQIGLQYRDCEVRIYKDMFYEFSKKKHCQDTRLAKEWDHILLTANLVGDKSLQKEYLDYHHTQFASWPEVSKGFCNADFQQLLLFKNGRQLMLVISIPKGKSLDELNPKTTENNPKVDQWNTLMKKYQEGIPGTKSGEVWVFLENSKEGEREKQKGESIKD
jgi:hypothetical protein